MYLQLKPSPRDAHCPSSASNKNRSVIEAKREETEAQLFSGSIQAASSWVPLTFSAEQKPQRSNQRCLPVPLRTLPGTAPVVVSPAMFSSSPICPLFSAERLKVAFPITPGHASLFYYFVVPELQGCMDPKLPIV